MFPTGSTLIFLSCLWAFSCIGKEIGEGHGQQVTLHLRNGEKLPVQLVSGAPSELLLKSPLFEEPFVFPISLIHGVEFPGNQQTPQSPFQINTSNRDVLYGDLLEAAEDTLIFSHAYLKRVLFKRDAVTAFYRKQARPIFDGSRLESWEVHKHGLGGQRPVNNELFRSAQARAVPVLDDEGFLSRSSIVLPDQFSVDLALSGTEFPRFSLQIQSTAESTRPDKALKLETWDNALVCIHQHMFEPVLTMHPGQSEVRLHMSYDGRTNHLMLFASNGHCLVDMQEVMLPDHHPVTLTLHSRGEGLQINEMVFQKQAANSKVSSFVSQQPRVWLAEGQCLQGQLLGDATQAFVMNENGTSHGIQMQAIERVFYPQVDSAPETTTIRLGFHDGTEIGAREVLINRGQVSIDAAFSEQTLHCTLQDLSFLRWEVPRDGRPREAQKPVSDSSTDSLDRLLFAEGQISGKTVFPNDGAAVHWQFQGLSSSFKLAKEVPFRIERRKPAPRASLLYDASTYPHTLFFSHGETIPARILFQRKGEIGFRVPYNRSLHRADQNQIKAIEFRSEHQSTHISEYAALVGPWALWEYLASEELSVFQSPSEWNPHHHGLDGYHVGLGGLGFGHPDVVTEVPVPTKSLFMRHRFGLPESFDAEELFLNLHCQYGLMVYLNDHKIVEVPFVGEGEHARELPIADDTLVQGWQRLDVSNHSHLLREGENSLAVVGYPLKTEDSSFLMHATLSTQPTTHRDALTAKPKKLLTSDPQHDGAEFSRVQRALTDFVLTHQERPKHVILTSNGDVLLGRLLHIQYPHMEFVSKSRNFVIPMARVLKCVHVEPLEAKLSMNHHESGTQDSLVLRVELIDGHQMDLQLSAASEQRFHGISPIYGPVTVPVEWIRSLTKWGAPWMKSDQTYDQWILHSGD